MEDDEHEERSLAIEMPTTDSTVNSSDPIKQNPLCLMTRVRSVTSTIKLVLKLGSGFFADAYDLFVIDIVLSILKEQSLVDKSGIGYSRSAAGVIASATSVGAVAGMIIFGLIGDNIGRKVGVLTTGSLVAIGSLLSASCVRSDSMSLMNQLALYRALLGFGIGGEYPLSASMASEGSGDLKKSTRLVAGVFSMQGVGMLFSSLLGYILLTAGCSLEFTWRFLLAFGAVPAIISLYLRMNMTFKPTAQVEIADTVTKTTLKEKVSSVISIIGQYKLLLIGTMLSWFLLDITFYGTGEFKHSVSSQLFPNKTGSPREKVIDDALFGVIISSIALPGYVCSFLFINAIGKWNLQFFGFLAMTIAYIIMAALLTAGGGSSGANLFVFGLTFFFTNFGPNASTFIIPSELYPSSIKATCHGISAAAGKIGAIVGAASFPQAIHAVGLNGVMFLCAGIAIAGALTTYVFLPKNVIDPIDLVPEALSIEENKKGTSTSADIDAPTPVTTVIGLTTIGLTASFFVGAMS